MKMRVPLLRLSAGVAPCCTLRLPGRQLTLSISQSPSNKRYCTSSFAHADRSTTISRTTQYDPSLLRGFSSRYVVDAAWGEQDTFQHVNNTQFIRWVESARIHMFSHALSTLSAEPLQTSQAELQQAVRTFMSARAVGPILKSITCKYRSPVVYPSTIVVGSRISNVSADRLSMQHRMIIAHKSIICAEAEDSIVTYDYKTLRKADMPPLIKRAIEQYMKLHNTEEPTPYRPPGV